MRIASRTDYALRAALELAAHGRGRPVKAEQIASAQAIPPRFLEKILHDLRRAGIVESRRGAEGGHLLAAPAEEILVGDVVRAIEGSLVNVSGVRPHDLVYEGSAEHLTELMVAARAALRDVLDRTSLADVVSGQLPSHVAARLAEPGVWDRRG